MDLKLARVDDKWNLCDHTRVGPAPQRDSESAESRACCLCFDFGGRVEVNTAC